MRTSTKYVTLVGAVLAQASTRPNLNWQFVVLDTEGVNAFAAPGGFIHITKGLLGLMKNEAELAGVLAHEIIHVTEKHTVNAIQKSDMASGRRPTKWARAVWRRALVAKIAEQAYSDILNNKFSRNDEAKPTTRVCSWPTRSATPRPASSSALTKLADRNKDAKEPNGMFASHPLMKDRIAKIDKTITEKKLTATATCRRATPRTSPSTPSRRRAIATVAEGSRGLAGGGDDKKPRRQEDGRQQGRRRKRNRRSPAAC